jgi:glutathione S-transferase
MRLFTEYPELRPFFLATAVLCLHLLALATVTSLVRTKRKVVVNPEDAMLGGAVGDADHPDVLRTKRAHQNALENAVPFFAVGLLYALSGPSHTGALAYFGTFVGARLLHSVFYLLGKQPFRSLSFGVGFLATIGMAVHVLRVALA